MLATRHTTLLRVSLMAGGVVHATHGQQLTAGQQAHLVLSLLPPTAQSSATVVLRDGEGDTVYRRGSGAFVCVSDMTTAPRLSLGCHHQTLDRQLGLERELSRSGLKGAEFRRRRCEEAEARKIDVPNGAMEISASLPVDSTGTPAAEMTVWYLLWLPHATAASEGVPDTDPGDGRPFLHQAETCSAHVMWSEVRPVDTGS